MPSLREKVTTYFRQLSFIADPREGNGSTSGGGRSRKSDDGNFITKYLEGRLDNIFVPGPDIKSGQAPNDLPDLPLSFYPTGPNTITAACTGPDEGLTGIKRSKLHLSAGSDIDFIDTNQDQEFEIRRSTSNSKQLQKNFNSSSSNANAMVIATTATTTTTNTSSTMATTTTTTTAVITTVRYRSDQNANKMNVVRTRKNTRNTGNDSMNPSSINSAITDSNKRTIAVNNSGNQKSNLIDDKQQQQHKHHSKQQHQHQQNRKTDAHHDESLKRGEDHTQKQQQQHKNSLELITNNCKDNHFDIDRDNEESTTKLIEESITQVVSQKQNQNHQHQQFDTTESNDDEPIAGVKNWKMETDHAYGISVSLYEYNMITRESMGNPIADCYGLVVRGNCAAMALADGVNWGEGARLAARSAVHGSLDYLDTAIFGVAQECKATSTRDVFVSLLRSFWEAHDCILEVGGALSTLTVAIVLPLGGQNTGKYVVCSCNVGDSLGYIYSKQHGVREFTQGSHDITTMRDMRDALGALGPADGNKPELGNLTLSMTIVDSGDIVFLTSDGISDNFDPVVGKFAEAWTPNSRIKIQDNHHSQLAPKRQNKSASALYTRSSKENKPSTEAITKQQQQHQKSHPNNLMATTMTTTTGTTNTIPVRPPRNKKVQGNTNNSNTIATTSTGPGNVSSSVSNRPKYMRSHTVIEPRGSGNCRNQTKFPRSAAGLPLVTGPQRHALTLLRLEDLLSYGINGSLKPCPSARKLCHLLVDFVKMITSARRKTLEQRELFYKLITDHDGIRREIELNRMQHKSTRKRIVDSTAFSSLPGKLDHATVVAFTVGSGLQTTEFKETNF